jgi:uncharacterized protein YlxW (UPF0749 family)
METQAKEKPENKDNAQTTTAATTQQTPTPNPEADMMATLFSFIKHPAVTAIGGFLIGKYFEGKKQEEAQEKVTEKLKDQIEDLKEQVEELIEERKALVSNEQRPLRLNESKYKSKGMIQLD